MTAFAPALPSPRLVSADLLKLRRRRGLVAVTALLTIGAIVLTYAVMQSLHAANPATHDSAGGVVNLGHVAFLASALGAVAAALVGSAAGAGDLDARVYRDLVVTGRSRLALFLSRIPGGLLFLLPFVAAGWALAAVGSVVFAGSVPAPSASLLATTGLWVVLQAVFYYLLALAIAALLGSRSYTVGIVLAWRLALTPLLTTITSLGVVRELVPGAALDHLAPAALGNAMRQGRPVPMSLAATAAVLVVWAVVAVVAGAWRDATRDA